MASGDDNSLITGLLDSKPQINGRDSPKQRRFRRCRSAPFAAGNIDGVDDDAKSIHSSEYFLENLHPSFRRVAIYLILYLVIGTICFYNFRDQIGGQKTNGIFDSLYFCIVTMTGVGYGDLVPNSTTTKLLACVFVFLGLALIGLILSKGADYLVEKQELMLIKALHMQQQQSNFKEMENNKSRYKCFMTLALLLLLMLLGTVFLLTVEKLDIVDTFYCVCCTITSLGYGDKSFPSKGGRVFAIFWILTSCVCLTQLLCYTAEVNTDNRQKELVKLVLTRKMTIWRQLILMTMEVSGLLSSLYIS